MSTFKRDNNSKILIPLSVKPKKNAAEGKATPIPALLKSHSLNIKIKEGNFISSEEESAEEDDKMHTISNMEDSNSYFSNNDDISDDLDPYGGKSRHGKKYNRKEKSLGELCKKFIYLYGSQDYCIIALDECTHTLGVERRRIYDIINILESFNVLSRLAKNQYEWRGVSQIQVSISKMRTVDDNDEFQAATSKRKKKKKSLGILCESFIKQFLTWRPKISLEQAARRISDNQIEDSKLKTKVRRLYDIANVLAALNLIRKTSLETRKPAFEWIGEEGLEHFIEEMQCYFKNCPQDSKFNKQSNYISCEKLVKVCDSNDISNSKISKSFKRQRSENENMFDSESNEDNDCEMREEIMSPSSASGSIEINSQVIEHLLDKLRLS